MRLHLRRHRFTWTLVFLTWFAQLCMPVAHAAVMGAHGSGPLMAYCGDPANAREALALLPAEIRNALDPDATSADHLASCAKLCAALAKLPPLPTLATAHAAPEASTVLAPSERPTTVARRHGLPPPSHGPPAQA